MSKYLYGASVQGIQDFIFKTNELKTIVGASEIIKDINIMIDKRHSDNIVINAAGNIKLIFDESQKDRLEKLVLNFPKEVRQTAYGITISQAVQKYEEGKLKDAFEKIEEKLAAQRNKVELPLDMSINILKLAPKTAYPMVEKDKDMATIQKEKANSSIGNIPKNKKNKTAVIHADGNGLGAMIASMTENLSTDLDVINAYKSFSKKLDNATQNAFDIAKKDFDEQDIRDVILGGDDVTIICNANSALKFTNKFLSEFEEETKKEFKNDGLSACAGIAYCNHKYPFHYAVNLAESLCEYAKNISREHSSVMFHNIQSSNFSDFKEYINKELTLENNLETIHLNYGPYFVRPFTNFSTITGFLHLAGALGIPGSPISRLREWLTMLGQDSIQAKDRLKRILKMMDLKKDIYKKEILIKNLQQFQENITLEKFTLQRGNEKYTPIGDVNTHLSVVDWSKDEI